TFAGGDFLHANPAEKHCARQSMLDQQNQGACAGKTASTDKHKSPSDIIQSFQKRSQFRTIAPKMVPKLLTSGVVSCLQSSSPEQNTPISVASSKPVVVPTQNYAVMQVAGHKGTFSLLALPCVAPALTQQVQQPSMTPSENLKLPIPRYQSIRSKPLSDKKPAQTCVLGAHNKIAVKASISLQASHVTTSTEDCPETRCSDSAEQAVLTEPDSARITVTTSVNQSSCVESGSPSVKKTETANNNTSEPSVVKEPLSKPTSPINVTKQSLRSAKTASATTREPSIVTEKLKESPTNSASSAAVLSPAVFGTSVQVSPSAPKGKLPILPYSRLTNSAFCKSKQSPDVTGVPGPSLRSQCEEMPALAKATHVPAEASDKRAALSSARGPRQTTRDAFSPSNKVDADSLKKLNSAASKRRSRKRRAPDDVLAFQSRRRKCIINKLREGRERVKADLQPPEDKKAEAVKKYRSIRPKPVVVMQAFAPVPSAALLKAPSPDHIDQDSFLNASLPGKYLTYKHGDAPAVKASDLSRSASSALPKPSHKCHVCSRLFQFKHHLRDHMNTHTNRRPYSCRVCRKAYIHSGSLSTHMKLHHSEGKPRKLVCCEFCAKVFGHAKVYFGHLREVHRVVINTEPSPGEQPLQDALKRRDTNIKETEEATER
ncbi:ZN438 protein, partial [Semnornis frantzii]|nr:ZN438 protein [Semnornis frantzii]